MKKYIFLTVLSVLFFSESTKAQCSYNSSGFYMSLSAPTTIGGITSDNCIYGGEYITCTALVAGNTYRVSTVGNTAFDTQITIFRNGLAVAYNDDAPTGTLQSEIYFTPTVTSDYDIQVNEHNCISNNTCMYLEVELSFVPVSVVTIPVVFHVVHYGEAYGQDRNISDAQIQDQINILNQDYRRMNSDFNNTPAIFAGVSADVQIEFCLAQRDPNGNSTSGIIRWLAANSTHSKSDFTAFIKPTTSWDRDSYLNFWIADITSDPPSTNVLYGFAQFPDPVFPANTDGVVCHYKTIGVSSNNFTTANKGRTATHEVGHWLGLYHTFEGGCNGVGDDCFDTPYQGISTWGNLTNSNCPGSFQSAAITCGSYDMYPNYMDYTDDDCLSMFTFGQKSRTRSTLLNFRAPLQSSLGCVPPPASWNCISPGNCQDPGTGNGVYSTQAACQSNCIQTSVYLEGVGPLIIYPNPTDQIVNIRFLTIVKQSIKIRLISTIGEIVFVEYLQNYSGEYSKKINLEGYSKGIYFLEIETHKGITNHKIILY